MTETAQKKKLESFERFFFLLYRDTCVRAGEFIRDDETAKDLVSEVFLVMWSKRQEFGGERDMKGFLLVSMRNACQNHLRRARVSKRHDGSVGHGLQGEQSHAGILHRIVDSERLKAVNEAVNRMPPQAKRVIELSRMGLGTDEISDVMGISPQTVRNTRVRGISFLRKRLVGYGRV